MTTFTVVAPAGEGTLRSLPLVVDLDGTLVATDTLVESVIRFVKRSPLNVFVLMGWLLSGRAGFKARVAAAVSLPVAGLPWRTAVVDWLRAEKRDGRPVVLATAAHRSIATAVAEELGLFDRVIATDGARNLKGSAKLAAIRETVGPRFVYAGDSAADVPVWRAAQAAVLVDVAPRVAAAVRATVPVEREFAGVGPSPGTWLKALRVHQWLKNLLLLVPMLMSFAFLDVQRVASAVIAFVAFSLTASATYVVNDLWDLDNDRAHPRKRARAFASGAIGIPHGLLAALLMLLGGVAAAASLSPGFLAMLLLYLVMTSAYSWGLKEYVLVDVIMLSLLYTLRILAGSVAVGVPTSSWLLAFAVFAFLSLALVKRCAELVTLGQAGADAARGRDYRVTDLAVLWPLGVGAALSAVVVFALFISAPETQARYATPHLLWLVAIGLTYWMARLWVMTSRGEMHDDPVVYAMRDRGSRMTVLAMLAVILAAHFVRLA